MKRVLPILLLLACGEEETSGSGTVSVVVAGEGTIAEGLAAGDGDEDLRDGFSVRYSKFLITVGDVRAARSSGGDPLGAPAVQLVDLVRVGERGSEIANFSNVAAARWDRFSYASPAATETTIAGEGATADDIARLSAGNYSLWVEGEATRGEERVTFAWGLRAPVTYDYCGPEEGDRGFAVTRGGTTLVEATFHGDHWFFDAFPGGVEEVERRAGWLLLADQNEDGEVTTEELAASPAAELFPSSEYNLSGGPRPVDSGLDWVEAQAQTLGHLQGEGECDPVVASAE